MAAQKDASSKDVCFSLFTKRTDGMCAFQLELMTCTQKDTSGLRSRKTN